MIQKWSTPYDWLNPVPRPGDIARAAFPYDESPDDPGPELHPVLVLAAGRRPSGSVHLLVAYGTSQRTDRPADTDFVLRGKELSGTGLTRDTRFVLERRIWLPYTAQFFVPFDGRPTPITGELGDPIYEAYLQKRAEAEARLGVCLVQGTPVLPPTPKDN